MKNKYILIELNSNNEFRTKMNILLDYIQNIPFNDVDVKIDTGCPYTTILTKRLNISDLKSKYLKQIDCYNKNVSKQVTFGVNDDKNTKDRYIQMAKNNQWINIPAVSFIHKCNNLNLCEIDITCNNVKINYDRIGNILIGMDIIGKMDNHIGMSKKTGKAIFLACPIDKINQDYLLALEEHFGLGTRISAAIINNSIRNKG